MRPLVRFAVAALCGWLVVPATAADPPRSNTLTPQEVADGWLLLFDGQTTFGWKTEGAVAVVGQVLRVGGEGDAGVTLTTPLPPDFELVAQVQMGHDATVKVYSGDGFDGFGHSNSRGELRLTSERTRDGRTTTLSLAGADGNKAGTSWGVKSDGPLPPLRLGFGTRVGGTMEIHSIKLRPLGLKPLFNTKDLSGWKVYDADPAKAKAEFKVTPAGELHVTGGPGDIQTEGKYADFVLQTEVKTTRPLVNSGIFFRCVPGELQNGYELQIQNAVVNDDRTKPLDFGTGAIYRRVPARKVVSTDGEWFTMTLIAGGPHLATWVNGYQTVDWTDDRKPDPNPRKGLRTEAGHISIQGHAPPTTADVLFRSIKIAEMSERK